MRFQHHDEIGRDFPGLVPGVIHAEGITPAADVSTPAGRFTAAARSRLAQMPESEFGEIRSWRRAFTQMGPRPPRSRGPPKSLRRRLQTQGSLPSLHPLVDLCNAASLAFAIPVAVLDVSAIAGDLQVRYAVGDEEYLTFSGETEHPAAGEVIFGDDAGRAHARRWTNRQSGLSAVRDSTTTALIVAEALHDSAAADMEQLTTAIASELDAIWSVKAAPLILTAAAPRFEF